MNNMNLNPVNAAAQAMSAPAESAQGLATLGRNNDSMLMHVTPNEVQGLQQLAQNMGGSLTRNPQTGLPEAGFFDFLGSMIPTIAGLGVGAMTGNPQLAGLAAGGAKTIQTGDLGAGILSGFGAYMGADTLNKVGDFGAGTSIATDNATGAFNADVLNNAASTNAPFMPPAAPTYAPSASLGPVQGLEAGSTGPNFGLAPDAAGGYIPGSSFTETTLPAVDVASAAPAFGGDIGAGFSKMTEPGGFDAYAQSIGKSPMSAGMGLALPALGTVAGMIPPPSLATEEEDSGWGPFKSIAERRRANNPMMLAEGGPVLDDGTGLAGLLDKRVGDEGEGMGQAAYFEKGGYLDIDSYLSPQVANRDIGYAAGANLNAGNVGIGANLQGMLGKDTLVPKLVNINGHYFDEQGNDYGIDYNRAQKMMGLNYTSAGGDRLGATYTPGQKRVGVDYASPEGNSVGLDVAPGYAGVRGQYNFEKGGYLDGPGDGMSDDIHATIEGKQPARLADGEFVIPADVVSHLGNGSTKAGAKQLYSMMDKIREARTGTKKQGKQIKASKYLPA